MKAILFDSAGSADVLYFGDVPEPTPADDELLVKVHTCALNRADILQRLGGYNPPPGASPILGMELAGEVVKSAGSWQIGDRVMAVVTGGAYAEYAVVPAGMAIQIPDNLTYEQATCIPEAFLTAYLNLFKLGNFQSGESVLIHAGASGVGTAAIQLARIGHASHIFTTASSDDKLATCRELGATGLINYKTQNFADVIKSETDGRGVDVILDFIGAAYWNDNLKAIARYGRLAIIGLLGGVRGELEIGSILGKSLTVTGTTLRPMPLPRKSALAAEFAEYALDHFARGELVPVLDTVFPLQEAADAHKMMESNANTGKIVLKVI